MVKKQDHLTLVVGSDGRTILTKVLTVNDNITRIVFAENTTNNKNVFVDYKKSNFVLKSSHPTCIYTLFNRSLTTTMHKCLVYNFVALSANSKFVDNLIEHIVARLYPEENRENVQICKVDFGLNSVAKGKTDSSVKMLPITDDSETTSDDFNSAHSGRSKIQEACSQKVSLNLNESSNTTDRNTAKREEVTEVQNQTMSDNVDRVIQQVSEMVELPETLQQRLFGVKKSPSKEGNDVTPSVGIKEGTEDTSMDSRVPIEQAYRQIIGIEPGVNSPDRADQAPGSKWMVKLFDAVQNPKEPPSRVVKNCNRQEVANVAPNGTSASNYPQLETTRVAQRQARVKGEKTPNLPRLRYFDPPNISAAKEYYRYNEKAFNPSLPHQGNSQPNTNLVNCQMPNLHIVPASYPIASSLGPTQIQTIASTSSSLMVQNPIPTVASNSGETLSTINHAMPFVANVPWAAKPASCPIVPLDQTTACCQNTPSNPYSLLTFWNSNCVMTSNQQIAGSAQQTLNTGQDGNWNVQNNVPLPSIVIVQQMPELVTDKKVDPSPLRVTSNIDANKNSGNYKPLKIKKPTIMNDMRMPSSKLVLRPINDLSMTDPVESARSIAKQPILQNPLDTAAVPITFSESKTTVPITFPESQTTVPVVSSESRTTMTITSSESRNTVMVAPPESKVMAPITSPESRTMVPVASLKSATTIPIISLEMENSTTVPSTPPESRTNAPVAARTNLTFSLFCHRDCISLDEGIAVSGNSETSMLNNAFQVLTYCAKRCTQEEFNLSYWKRDTNTPKENNESPRLPEEMNIPEHRSLDNDLITRLEQRLGLQSGVESESSVDASSEGEPISRVTGTAATAKTDVKRAKVQTLPDECLNPVKRFAFQNSKIGDNGEANVRKHPMAIRKRPGRPKKPKVIKSNSENQEVDNEEEPRITRRTAESFNEKTLGRNGTRKSMRIRRRRF